MGTDSGDGRAQADREFFAEAEQVLEAGVSASARINPALGRAVLGERGDGPWMIAPGGAKILDFHGGFGASFLGHNHPGIRAGVEAALDMGMVLGPETEHPRRLAQKIVELVPGAELVRYSNSGSEATMSAIRLARAHTGRKKILKFEGHFHGLHELVNFSTHPDPKEPVPGELIAPTIDSAGIPEEFAEFTLVAPWHDLAAVENAFARYPDEIAAVIVEPVNYNSGCLVAEKGYMEAVQEVVRDNGAVLIYDEILSGFRTGTDCAQGYYGVTPDVTVLGKAVAGGMPLSVVAGKRAVMETFSPLGWGGAQRNLLRAPAGNHGGDSGAGGDHAAGLLRRAGRHPGDGRQAVFRAAGYLREERNPVPGAGNGSAVRDVLRAGPGGGGARLPRGGEPRHGAAEPVRAELLRPRGVFPFLRRGARASRVRRGAYAGGDRRGAGAD